MLLGFGFLVSQLFAWRQLVQQGIYVASNPHSSFFYLLTATHGVHLLGGLMALVYLLCASRLRRRMTLAMAKSQAAADAVTLYWHFMDVVDLPVCAVVLCAVVQTACVSGRRQVR